MHWVFLKFTLYVTKTIFILSVKFYSNVCIISFTYIAAVSCKRICLFSRNTIKPTPYRKVCHLSSDTIVAKVCSTLFGQLVNIYSKSPLNVHILIFNIYIFVAVDGFIWTRRYLLIVRITGKHNVQVGLWFFWYLLKNNIILLTLRILQIRTPWE